MFEMIILLLFIILVLVFIIIQKVRQFNKLKDIFTTEIDKYDLWLENFSVLIKYLDLYLDKIDSEGIFRSEDEVGIFYQSLYTMFKTLSEYGIVDESELNPELNEMRTPKQQVIYERKLQRRKDIPINEMVTSIKKKIKNG